MEPIGRSPQWVPDYSQMEWPPRPWTQLTMQEINECIVHTGLSVYEGDVYIFARAIEALLQGKNA